MEENDYIVALKVKATLQHVFQGKNLLQGGQFHSKTLERHVYGIMLIKKLNFTDLAFTVYPSLSWLAFLRICMNFKL